jgi:secondary thiamine-phosphate synthase enzyme
MAMSTGTAVITDAIRVSTKGNADIIDITDRARDAVRRSGLTSGIMTLFVVGSTAGLTTIEYEPGLVADIQETFERVAPEAIRYAHHERWGDGNGHSHVRASLLGPSLTVPFSGKELVLGTWQQIILIDFDTHGRQREVVVQIIGV